MEMLPGINEKYQTIRSLGNGSSGTVYLARDCMNGTLCSIKMINRTNCLFPVSQQEYAILKRLDHPSIPKTIEKIECIEAVYLVFEYFEGMPLDYLLEEKGAINERQAASWALQICDVLKYLHSIDPHPIIYRDLKPSNILLANDGTIKLIDFGAACEYRKDELSETEYLGTRGYAAPEQYYGGKVSHVADIYCLGITINTLMTGKNPKPSIPAGLRLSKSSGMSDAMYRIIMKCTMSDPGQRFRDIGEAAEAIKGVLSGDMPVIRATPSDKPENAKTLGKTVIAVWDNACFAVELSYVIASVTGSRVFLADLDLFSPSLDLLIDVDVKPYLSAGIASLKEKSGLNLVIDALSGTSCRPDIIESCCIKRLQDDNLCILTGNYSLEDYEYFNDTMIIRLIEHASRSFDITVLAIGKFLYDSFNIISLIKADMILIPLVAELCKLREFCRYAGFLQKKQNIGFDKARFIAYDYEPSTDLDKSAIDEITGGRFSGTIRCDRRRDLARSSGEFYAAKMNKQSIGEYIEVLKNIGIMSKMKGKLQCL